MITALGVSVILHEMAHAWVALKLGDPTGRDDNRLSWNPIHHVDPWMTILVPILIFWASGGRFMFGGAKPVRINPLNFANPGKGFMLSSLAGPVSNLLLACVGILLLLAMQAVDSDLVYGRDDAGVFHVTYNGFFLCFFVLVNLFLACFNLIPIPPLDGSRALRYFLPERGQALLDRVEPMGLFILVALMFMGFFRWALLPVYVAWGTVMVSLFDGELTQAFLDALSG
jgi:Zn-dependent protease